MIASYTTHNIQNLIVERKRILPGSGKVTVKAGQKVDYLDVVAVGMSDQKHVIIDIARKLRVSPRRADTYIKINRSDKILKNDIIAETPGFFGQEVKSPIDGQVVAFGGGKIVLETGGKPVELLAGIQGQVTEIIGDRGVMIRANGTIIQGLWGNGRLETGVMMSIIDGPDELCDPGRLDFSLRSSIILGGYVDSADLFNAAADLTVRGIVLGSMSSDLIPVALKMPYPILLLDGFGRRPINLQAYDLLNNNLRRIMTINAVTNDSASSQRPDIFIPVDTIADSRFPDDMKILSPGQTVRMVSLIAPSKIGQIIRINPFQTILPNGIRSKTADIQLENGEQVSFPLTNLEVLG
ncbi:MAG: hypothetical protein WCP19_00780 [Chloroflexota bacterium]